MTYFSAFPTITYANTVVTDLTRRVTVPPSVLRQPTAFSPYTVTGGQREDTVSYLYYGQDDDDWLISLANQIVDPYYGWYLDIDELTRFIITKYGSLPDAMLRIDHWLCNWSNDSNQISTGYYQALTENLKKYWIPVYGQGSEILAYRRRQEDWVMATNMLLDVHVTGFHGAKITFGVGELATLQDVDGNAKGTGELVWVSGDTVRIKDVQGDQGDISGANILTTSSGQAFISSMEPAVLLIPIDEIVYFSPVTKYDVEYDKNEENKEVLLVQDAYRGIMYTELASSLRTPTT